MKINNLRIRTRLAAAFALLLALTVVNLGVAWTQLSAINATSERLATAWLPGVAALGRWHGEIDRMRALELRHVIETDAAGKDALEGQLAEAVAEVRRRGDGVAGLLPDEEARARFAALGTAVEAHLKLQPELLADSRQGTAAGAEVVRRSSATMEAIAAAADRLGRHLSDNAVIDGEAAHDGYSSGIEVLVVASVLCLLAGIGLAWITARSITRPLAGAVRITERVAAGDLSTAVPSEARDELGDLMRSLARMEAGLRTMVGQVRAGVDGVSVAAAEIAQGSSDLSMRTEQQASNLEEANASMQQLAAAVRQNADHAREASGLAAAAQQVAAKGGEAVAHVVDTMGAISTASYRIAEIIAVIDGIAFQTNILALNAAVEAARAGEQGRGFAVVAGEVRSLAQRAAQAAREINTLITDSVAKVESGVRQVHDAGTTMTEIVATVRKVAGLIGEIAAASTEQSTGIAQVSTAVVQLDDVTAQNAALVEQSSASAHALQEQSAQLAAAVAAFRLQAGRDG